MKDIPPEVLMEAYRVLLQASSDATIGSNKAVDAWEAAEQMRPHLVRLGLVHEAVEA